MSLKKHVVQLEDRICFEDSLCKMIAQKQGMAQSTWEKIKWGEKAKMANDFLQGFYL